MYNSFCSYPFNEILVSIITVCYNSELTINRTINSILNQSYRNIEYIIIDGASLDSTLDIVNSYIPAFNGRLRIVSERDKGIYDAMNKGITLAKGEIIGLVNSDDWLDEKMIYDVVDAYLENECAAGIYTGNLIFHYSNSEKKVFYSNQIRFSKKIQYDLMPIRHPATYVSRSVYQKIGLFDVSFKINADKDFIFRCIKENINFYFIDKPLSNMSDSGISNSVRGCKKGFYDELLFAKKHDLTYFAKIRLLSYYLLKESIKFIIPRCFLSILK